MLHIEYLCFFVPVPPSFGSLTPILVTGVISGNPRGPANGPKPTELRRLCIVLWKTFLRFPMHHLVTSWLVLWLCLEQKVFVAKTDFYGIWDIEK